MANKVMYAIFAGWVDRVTHETRDMFLVEAYPYLDDAMDRYKDIGPDYAHESPYVEAALGKDYGSMIGRFSLMDIEIERVWENDDGFEESETIESKRIAYVYEGHLAPEMDEWALSPDDEGDVEEFREITSDWEDEAREFRKEFRVDQDNIDLK